MKIKAHSFHDDFTLFLHEKLNAALPEDFYILALNKKSVNSFTITFVQQKLSVNETWLGKGHKITKCY